MRRKKLNRAYGPILYVHELRERGNIGLEDYGGERLTEIAHDSVASPVDSKA